MEWSLRKGLQDHMRRQGPGLEFTASLDDSSIDIIMRTA